MMKPLLVSALAAAFGAASACGKDFPLTFHTIAAKDVLAFPGASGTFAPLRSSRPADLQKEPKAISRHPLYGECRDTSGKSSRIFRLDESKGDGRGYDLLIVDMNENLDLTDDAVVMRATAGTERSSRSVNEMLFGPIQAPAGKEIAGGRPAYFAQVYLYRVTSYASSRSSQTIPSGQLTLRPGWYLEATVELDGSEQKVGVIDGDCNLRLGDVGSLRTVSSRGEQAWYFSSADSWLADYDRSGAFERDVAREEACPFGPILFLGKKAYKVSVTASGDSLQVEPWADALANVKLRPCGDQVASLTLAWEQRDREWQLIRPAVVDGGIQVPPGRYRLYACSLIGKPGSRDQVMLSGIQRGLKPATDIRAGKENTLTCGGPLEIKVLAAKETGSSRVLLDTVSSSSRLSTGTTLRINASVVGAGGELYNTFLKGDRLQSRPAKPAFTVTDTAGKTVGNGNLEYG